MESTQELSPKRSRAASALVTVQVVLFIAGAALTILWIGWDIMPRTWWTTLSLVGILLLSLVVFSFQETKFGISKISRERTGNPDSMGGPLELVAFISWLFLIVNMVVTVVRVIRAVKSGL